MVFRLSAHLEPDRRKQFILWDHLPVKSAFPAHRDRVDLSNDRRAHHWKCSRTVALRIEFVWRSRRSSCEKHSNRTEKILRLRTTNVCFACHPLGAPKTMRKIFSICRSSTTRNATIAPKNERRKISSFVRQWNFTSEKRGCSNYIFLSVDPFINSCWARKTFCNAVDAEPVRSQVARRQQTFLVQIIFIRNREN